MSHERFIGEREPHQAVTARQRNEEKVLCVYLCALEMRTVLKRGVNEENTCTDVITHIKWHRPNTSTVLWRR